MTKTRNLLALIGVFILFQSCGCGTLEPGGAYNSNKVLYDCDLTIATSFTAIHGFVLWEYQNRTNLNSPEIKAFADKIRENAPKAFKAAITARDIYAASTSTEDKTNL